MFNEIHYCKEECNAHFKEESKRKKVPQNIHKRENDKQLYYNNNTR